jgi:hypothetical protein
MPPEATQLEADEDVRLALRKHRIGAGTISPKADEVSADDGPRLFRPTLRPSTPVLTALDDGLDDGESVRLRESHFVIRRTEGDMYFPNDGQMSARHAELR